MDKNEMFTYINIIFIKIIIKKIISQPFTVRFKQQMTVDLAYIDRTRTWLKTPTRRCSIQFKALFRVDINHTYNTISNELLKSTMVYNNTYNHTYKHIK